MKNEKYYKETFDEVHASYDLRRKVIDMKDNKEGIMKKRVMRFAAAGIAAFTLLIAASNGICYAATGETWVKKITVIINGNPKEVDMEYSKKGDLLIGEAELENTDDGVVSLAVASDEELPDDIEITYDGQKGGNGKKSAKLSEDEELGMIYLSKDEELGMIYLSVCPKEKSKGNEYFAQTLQIDITDDFEDGTAEGTFKYQGKQYKYTVNGTLEKPDISITECE